MSVKRVLGGCLGTYEIVHFRRRRFKITFFQAKHRSWGWASYFLVRINKKRTFRCLSPNKRTLICLLSTKHRVQVCELTWLLASSNSRMIPVERLPTNLGRGRSAGMCYTFFLAFICSFKKIYMFNVLSVKLSLLIFAFLFNQLICS